MKKIQTVLSAIALSAAFFCTAGHAATAASSMHYGQPLMMLKAKAKSKDSGAIIITNYTYQTDYVSAWFTDGSSNIDMPIYPEDQSPMNMISIENSFPYVNIEVQAQDGTVLYAYQPVYPGQNVNIGPYNPKLTKTPTVTVTK